MYLPSREEVFAECEKMGEAWARAQAQEEGPARSYFAEWIFSNEMKQRKNQEAQNFLLQMKSINATRESTDAARKSAHSSLESAKAAKTSAFWTMVAAIATTIGVIIQLVVDIFFKH